MKEKTFEYRGPVNPEKHLFVERGQVYTWANMLREGKSLFLQSPQRTGKTTQLLHLQRHMVESKRDCCIYLDMAEHAKAGEQAVMESLRLGIIQQTGVPFPLELLGPDIFDLLQKQLKKNIYILVDNLDSFLFDQSGDWLLDDLQRELDYIEELLSGRRCLYSLAFDHGAFVPFRRDSSGISLPYFDETEVGNLMKLATAKFPDELQAPVYDWTNGHPYHTCRLLGELDVQRHEGHGVEQIRAQLSHTVKQVFLLGQDERQGKALHKVVNASSRDSRDYCYEKYGIAEVSDGKPVFNNRIYRDLIEHYREESRSRIGHHRLALRSISLGRYRCFRGAQIKELPVDAPWIFLTGENAYGKTCLLQAIAIALVGPEGAHDLVDETTEISVDISAGEGAYSFSYLPNDHFAPFPFKNLVGYGPSRLRFISDKDEDFNDAQSIHVFSLFKQKGVLLDLERDWLKDELLEKLSGNTSAGVRIDNVLALIAKLLPHVDEVALDGTKGIVFSECGRKVKLGELSAGHKSIFAMIGDLLIRLFKIDPEVVEPAQFRAIVLIDELENHLHPRWQAQFPKLLSETFPYIQFIASTHGVVPFLGAPKGSVVIKTERNESGYSDIVWLKNIRIEELTPDTILSSPIFDMDRLYNLRFDEPPAMLRTESNYEQVTQHKKLEHLMDRLDDQYQAYVEKSVTDERSQEGAGRSNKRGGG